MQSDWMNGCKERRCGEFDCMLWDIEWAAAAVVGFLPSGPVSRLNYSTTYDTRTKTDANNIYHLFRRGEVSNHSQLFSGRFAIYR